MTSLARATSFVRLLPYMKGLETDLLSLPLTPGFVTFAHMQCEPRACWCCFKQEDETCCDDSQDIEDDNTQQSTSYVEVDALGTVIGEPFCPSYLYISPHICAFRNVWTYEATIRLSVPLITSNSSRFMTALEILFRS
jgi:hypothetical protein